MSKYAVFSEILETRIRAGDYTIRNLPTEQELAEEIGASRKTARRVLGDLMKKGLLLREPHGRLAINRHHVVFQGKLQLALLTPAFNSPGIQKWHAAIDRAVKKAGAMLRMIDYVHWDDPVIIDALEEFDGVFLAFSSEEISQTLLERIRQAEHLVALDADLTAWGIPSLQMLPPSFIHCLGDHLLELGHDHIDCLNTQPHDSEITRWIEHWRLWQGMHKVQGQLIDTPVEPYGSTTPKAYQTIANLLDKGDFKATALICLTDGAAVGAIRALQERGLQVGRDVSVCGMEGNDFTRFAWPSRTCLEETDPGIYVELCLDWMAQKTAPWVGPKLINPTRPRLFAGESSGPVCKIKAREPKGQSADAQGQNVSSNSDHPRRPEGCNEK